MHLAVLLAAAVTCLLVVQPVAPLLVDAAVDAPFYLCPPGFATQSNVQRCCATGRRYSAGTNECVLEGHCLYTTDQLCADALSCCESTKVCTTETGAPTCRWTTLTNEVRHDARADYVIDQAVQAVDATDVASNCDGSPCQHGTCVPTFTAYQCVCSATDGFSQPNCQWKCPSGRLCTTAPNATSTVYESTPCPAGTYCPLSAVIPTPSIACTPGNFCPPGSTSPTRCPIDYQCPNSTMSAGVQCSTAGKYCDSTGTITPIDHPVWRCPLGQTMWTTEWSATTSPRCCPDGTQFVLNGRCYAGGCRYSYTVQCSNLLHCCEKWSETCTAYNCLSNGWERSRQPFDLYIDTPLSPAREVSRQCTNAACMYGTACVPTYGSYQCSCPIPDGFTGQNCTWACPPGRLCLTAPDVTTHFEYETCPAGSICPDTPSLIAHPCNITQYCPSGSLTAVPCPAASYCPNASIAIDCPGGSYCGAGAVTPTICPEGRYCPVRSDSPRHCDIGFYCPTDGLAAAIPCTNGWQCNTNDIVQPTPCPAGRFCSPGYWGTPCPRYHYCPQNTTAPIPSSPGTYIGGEGAATDGEPCPAGHLCPNFGTTTPAQVQAGYHAPAGSINATACVSGTVCRWPGASGPEVCPAGTYCQCAPPTTVCTVTKGCTSGSYCPEGSTAPLPCKPGEYCDPTYGQSGLPCWEGSYCAGGSVKPTTCPAGYYCPRNSSTPIPCTQSGTLCAEGSSAPQPCPAGFQCQAAAAGGVISTAVPCPEGHTSEVGSSACSVDPSDSSQCASSFMRSDCHWSSGAIGIFVMIAVVCAGLLGCMVTASIRYRRRRKADQSRPQGAVHHHGAAHSAPVVAVAQARHAAHPFHHHVHSIPGVVNPPAVRADASPWSAAPVFALPLSPPAYVHAIVSPSAPALFGADVPPPEYSDETGVEGRVVVHV